LNTAPPPASIAVPVRTAEEGMKTNNVKDTIATSNPSERLRPPAKAVQKKKKKKKQGSPPPLMPLPPSISLPIKNENQNINNPSKPFDEHEDDVPSDISCGVDEEKDPQVVVVPATPTSNSCSQLQVASPRVPSDEIDVPAPSSFKDKQDEINPLVASPKPSSSPTSAPINKAATSTPAFKPSASNATHTPETQASPLSPNADFLDAYSHSSPHDDTNDISSTNKRLFYSGNTSNHNDDDEVAFLEEGDYQKPIAKSVDYDGDDSGNDEGGSKVVSSLARRNHRRCFLGCFCVSLVMIAAATGVAVYMSVFQNGSGGRRSDKAGINDGPLPTMSPTLEPTAPTSSPAPSLAPSLSAFPSDVPSFVPSESPSDEPSSVPSVSPSDAPSTVPTNAPTRDFSTVLQEYLYGTYGVVFQGDQSPARAAVEWLNQEAQQTVGGGTMEMTSDVAQRFALLAVEFSVMNVDWTTTEEDPAVVLGSGNTTVDATDAANSSTTFFSAVRQATIPTGIWNSQHFVHQCDWTGVECNEDNHVTTLRWDYRDYTGTIPPEISILTNLTHLDLSNNYLKGTIPEELYYLTNLEKLYLFKNFLTGTISTRIGDLDKITHLQLSHNELSGSIPTQLKSDSGSENGVRPLGKF
jgi:Leucine rich repeat